jgi:hypothetical protein
MALDPIILQIIANTSGVSSALSGVTRSVSGVGNAVDEARARTARLRQELEQARSGGASMDEIRTRTDALNESLNSSAGRAAAMTDKLTGLRNIGAGMAAAGMGGLALANNLIEVAEEGNAVEARLESILKAQNRLGDLGKFDTAVNDVAVRGHFDDDDQLRDAAVKMASFSVETKHASALLEMSARQARTMGTEVGGVAEQLAKAYASGNAGALKKSGVVITPQEIASIKEAYAISQKVGQAKFMQVIGPAIANNTVALADSLTAAKAASNDAARALDDAMTATGTGAANAKVHIDLLKASLITLGTGNPAILENAGYIGYIGSTALAAGGSILSLGSQIGIMAIGMQSAGITGTSAMASIRAAAIATGASISAILIPLALLATALIAAYKAYQWTKEAMSKSDEKMKKGTAREKFVYNAANFLSPAEGGEGVDPQAAAIMAKMRAGKGKFNPAMKSVASGNIQRAANGGIQRSGGAAAMFGGVAGAGVGIGGGATATGTQTRRPDGRVEVRFAPLVIGDDGGLMGAAQQMR